ncbi:CBS domain-containing protein [Thiomicrospira sp. ALE5]|uniref:CBS domain-containing protein n=1 Tax=Thiomicrospira sp. ALE5 TaxID=748650 RepID=UPI0008E1E51E|nr:CBS domain-containing protein [Thiomicrospira sp. ALE5]SFR51337.1 acetoin utilization protein AcuB [Thiomicrospira sp. ALE5]
MFIVYSPEGRQSLATRFERPVSLKKVVQPSEVQLNKTFLEQAADNRQQGETQKPSPQIAAYQETKAVEHDHHLVVKAFEIMSQPVVSLGDDASLEQAWSLMQQQKVRHLPLLHDQRLVGIISDRDLWQHHNLGELWSTEPGSVMWHAHRQVITTHPDADIRHIAWVMGEYKVGALPVMNDDDALLGVITRTDLIVRLANQPALELYA